MVTLMVTLMVTFVVNLISQPKTGWSLVDFLAPWYFEDFLVTCGSVVNFVVTPIRIKPLVM